MKRVAWVTLVALSLFCAIALHAEEPRSADAKQKVAEAYFAALATGDVAKVDEVTDVPFSFDRKEKYSRRENRYMTLMRNWRTGKPNARCRSTRLW